MYKSGLVLEGGGLRAIFTSGVLDAFMENEIKFPYVIGVSAGSCNAVSFIAQNLHRMRDIIIGYSDDERYMSFKSLIKNGEYINTKWVYGELSYDIFPINYERFENSGVNLCVVTTNIETGKAEYFYPKHFRNGCPEIVASCALPIASKPVRVGENMYYDGGITDSIPLKKAYDDGCEKCVVILTQHRDYAKRPIHHDKAVNRVMKRHPNVAKSILNRHEMYNNQKQFIFEEEKEGNAFVICPDEPLHCPVLDSDIEKLQKIYDLGYKQGIENIDKIKEFLK